MSSENLPNHIDGSQLPESKGDSPKPENDTSSSTSNERGLTRFSLETSFSVPLPPPSILEAYEGILPGTAERLLSLTENEISHRHTWEKSEQHNRNQRFARGQHLGALLGMALIAVAGYSVYANQPLVAFLCVSVGGIPVLNSFIRFLIDRFSSSDEPTTPDN